MNIGHAVAQLLWMLTGTDDGGMIGFYHRFGLQFCEDDFRLPGALGRRVFASEAGDQVEQVVQRLSQDPASRRALVQIFLPADAVSVRRDIPCFTAVQFLIRERRLQAVGTMRSQSAFTVLPHDLFLLTALQEVVATRLGLDVGPYVHWAASMHIYEHEASAAKLILNEEPTLPIMMPAMPRLVEGWRGRLIDVEADIRQKLTADINRPIDLSRYALDPYWRGLLAVLVAIGRVENGASMLPSDLTQVMPELRGLTRQIDMRKQQSQTAKAQGVA